MGILKSAKLKGIRVSTVIAIVMMILMVSTITVNAMTEQVSETRDEGGAAPKDDIVEYKEERIEETPYKTLYQYSADLAWNESLVSVEGENGTKRVVGKVITKEGKMYSNRCS